MYVPTIIKVLLLCCSLQPPPPPSENNCFRRHWFYYLTCNLQKIMNYNSGRIREAKYRTTMFLRRHPRNFINLQILREITNVRIWEIKYEYKMDDTMELPFVFQLRGQTQFLVPIEEANSISAFVCNQATRKVNFVLHDFLLLFFSYTSSYLRRHRHGCKM